MEIAVPVFRQGVSGAERHAAAAGAVAGFENRHPDVAIVGEQLVGGGQPADSGTDDYDMLAVEAVPRGHVRIVGDLHLLISGVVERGPGAG